MFVFCKSKWTQNKLQILVKHKLSPARILTLTCCIWHYQAQISHSHSNQGNASSPYSASGFPAQPPWLQENSDKFSCLWYCLEFRATCFWLRKWDGHRVVKNRVSHLRLSSLFQISILLPLMAIVELTDSVSEIKWTSIWHTILSSSFLYLLYCALKLLFIACDQVISFHCHCFVHHARIQSNITTRAWKHHTYHIPGLSGWSSLWVRDWRWAVRWTNLRGGESSKYSPSSLIFTGPVNKYL